MIRQITAVIQLELKKTFFARRSLWIYLLAVGPALLYLIHAIDVTHDHEHRQALAAAHPVSSAALRSIAVGATAEDVTAKLGEPYAQPSFRRRGQGTEARNSRSIATRMEKTISRLSSSTAFCGTSMNRIAAISRGIP